jgi:transcription elongation factor Elf1
MECTYHATNEQQHNNNTTTQLKYIRCYVCGHHGHICCSTNISIHLPNPPSDIDENITSTSTSTSTTTQKSTRSTLYCSNCSQKGHMSYQCTAPKLDININDMMNGGARSKSRVYVYGLQDCVCMYGCHAMAQN